MKTNRLPSTLAFLLAMATAGSQTAWAAADHHHHHGDGAEQKLQLNAGKKWVTDASLRQAMDGINQAMVTAVPLIHKNRFSEADYAKLAAGINEKVAYAVANCQLAPEADAMLHLLIAELTAGAEAMAGKGGTSRHDGAVRVLQALQSYGKYFQHPNWKAARG